MAFLIFITVTMKKVIITKDQKLFPHDKVLTKNWAHAHYLQTLANLWMWRERFAISSVNTSKECNLLVNRLSAKVYANHGWSCTSLVAYLKNRYFTFFSSEAQGMKSIEQLAIYLTFKHDTKICKYFIGLYLVSNIVGTELSAPNIMKVLVSSLESIEKRLLKILCEHVVLPSMGIRCKAIDLASFLNPLLSIKI